MENQTVGAKSNMMIPFAIVIAGILIAGAVLYSNQGLPSSAVGGGNEESGSTDSVRPVSKSDHMRGNPDALVKIVEYSDFECPYCKQLHPVKARSESVASECVNEIGGNDAFWRFANRFFELTPSNNQTDIATIIPQIVRELGIDEQSFNTCMDSGKYDERIESDIANAFETGGRGTPWSIVIAPNGKTFQLSGAQPYASVKQLIEIALQEK